MQLRDARLGDPEHLADLAEGQLLVVVERDDELLALGRSEIASASASFTSVCSSETSGSGPVSSSIVSMRAIESPPPEGDHSSSSAPTDEREISSRLSSSSSSVTPSFFAISSSVGARMQLLLERGDRALDLARAGANRARHPVERAELVDDRPADARHRERLELDLADGSKRSIAPMSPSRPYETRSCSSTCAGRLAPTRPATNLTSGAYVRISRSRSS